MELSAEVVAAASWRDRGSQWTADQIGSKAAGLSRMPCSWTPAWLVVRPQGRRDQWTPALRELLDRAEQWIVVRSNGPHESLRPAEGKTSVVPARLDAVQAAVAEGTAHVDSWPLLQAAVDPVVFGVLSNERRVSRDRGQFAVEGPVNLLGPELRSISPASDSPRRGALTASNVLALHRRLRDVAAALARVAHGQEIRCEWAWDGDRLWVLQADVLPTRSVIRRSWLDDPVGPPPEFGTSAATATSPKLASIRLFAGLGWPVVPSIEIPVAEWEIGKSRRRIERAGLSPSPERPVVVRTDLRGADTEHLLPTSTPCSSWRALDRFVGNVIGAQRKETAPGPDLVLLIAPFVDARAGAWAYADPSTDRTQVDALWGHPDGLQTLGHDTYVVDSGAERVRRCVRHKPACVRPRGAGWRLESIEPPWDWRPVLSRQEVKQAATWATELASHLRSPVHVLILARIAGRRGPTAMLPLFSHTLRAPRHTGIAPSGIQTLRISRPADLRRRPPRHVAALLFEPGPKHLRDVELLRSTAEASKRWDLPVVLRGSQLGHAFYVLRAEGADVFVGVQSRDTSDFVCCLITQVSGISRVASLPGHIAVRCAERQVQSLIAMGSPAAEVSEAQRSLDLAEQATKQQLRPRDLADLPMLRQEVTEPPWAELDVLGHPASFLAESHAAAA